MPWGPKGCQCCKCRNTDILILIDMTGSMSSNAATVANAIRSIKKRLESESCKWGLATYKDKDDAGYSSGWKVEQTFTDLETTLDKLEDLVSGGGDDFEEDDFSGLKNAATEWETTLGGRANDDEENPVYRRLVWIGDAPGKNGVVSTGSPDFADPGGTYPTRAETIAAFEGTKIQVWALDFGGLNSAAPSDEDPGAATEICEETDGEFNGFTTGDALKVIFCKMLRPDRPPAPEPDPE